MINFFQKCNELGVLVGIVSGALVLFSTQGNHINEIKKQDNKIILTTEEKYAKS